MNTLPAIIDIEDKSSPLKNCIRNTYRHLRKWAKRTQTDCFRIYGREMHEYPLAIDFYAGRYCVQYFSPDREDDEPPIELKEEVFKILSSLLGATEKSIYWRTRIKREKREQYEKIGESKEFFIVQEYGVKFRVNLVDYLDTGLFLDHRETRKIVAAVSKNKRVLNLFAYTCSFSVHAAFAGASFTKSVDMSNTYTDWGKDNFILNKLPLKKNEVVRADCLKFLDDEMEELSALKSRDSPASRNRPNGARLDPPLKGQDCGEISVKSKEKYDIIIIDPPTISRSKKMDQMFDIQIDYRSLIEKALKLLAKDGVIFFSTNSRRFVFNESEFSGCKIIDISSKTLPLDFHDPKIHRCWKISLL